jgi:hypothetical protein
VARQVWVQGGFQHEAGKEAGAALTRSIDPNQSPSERFLSLELLVDAFRLAAEIRIEGTDDDALVA